MITVFILSFTVVALILLAMSVGVLFGREPIKGSCGGMGALGIDTACDICGGDTQKCEDSRVPLLTQNTDKPLYHNADTRD